jgi:hypothetical protein
MSFRDYVRIASAVVTDAVREFDEGLSNDPDYAAARKAIAVKATSSAQAARSALQAASNTDTGKKVGERSRKISAVVAKAPVITAIGDTLSHKAGVPELLELRAQQPDSPWPLVWLAEGLQRLNRNRNVALTVRAPFEPLSAMVAMTAKTTGSLGIEDPVVRCQQGAWSLALKALNDDSSALGNLHVLARVYLARGFAEQAAPLSAMASLADSGGDLALVTLAMASKKLGLHDQARAAAAEAVVSGCSLGHHIAAEYALDRRDYGRSLELSKLVTSADRLRFFGVDPTATAVMKNTAESQSKKTMALARTVRTLLSEDQRV